MQHTQTENILYHEPQIIKIEFMEGIQAHAEPGVNHQPVEGQLPSPTKLTADEVRQRMTPIEGVAENRRGDFIITDAHSKLEVQREMLGYNVRNNFAVKAVAQAVNARNNRKAERAVFNDFAPRRFTRTMRNVKRRIHDLRGRGYYG